MDGAARTRQILKYLKQIEESGLAIDRFLQKHKVPFGRAQYFRYKKAFNQGGEQELHDGRNHGNHRMPLEATNFLLGFRAANSSAKLADCQVALENHLSLHVDIATISRLFQAHPLSVIRAQPAALETFEVPYAGFEILAALAGHLKWPEFVARHIQQATSPLVREAEQRPGSKQVDRRGRDTAGHFTARYNKLRDVRRQRFAAIADKRRDKDLSRLRICHSGRNTLAQKALAILALPIVTLNGTLRSVNTPMGNALQDFAGYNYKDATLDKFLRELKYVGMAESLVRSQIGFWQKHWRAAGLDPQSQHGPLLCYYIDGHTKALWSSKRVQKNKVTMVGRVMGCLEQVFVHDALGRPTYFETHSGRAPWGEYALSLFDKIEKQLEGPGPKLQVIRLLVLDGANNSVKTMRAFAAQDKYYFITTLDKNQWQPRRIRSEGPRHRYDHGQAFVSDCEIELEDSTEKGYLIVVRAIKMEWDDGKFTVLITNLPATILTASGVAKAYFDRWPLQELWFRDSKNFAALHRVAGYGKKLVEDRNVQAKQKQIQERIGKLRAQLREPLAELAVLDQQLHTWIEKERRLRVQSKVVNGHRQLKPEKAKELEHCQSTIAALERQKKKTCQPFQHLYKSLRHKEKEWLRLQGKEQIYKVDVELDQILTSFRVAFVNLCTYFQMMFLDGAVPASTSAKHKTLASLLHRIFMLPAAIELSPEWRRVYLKRNLKDQATMTILQQALPKLNQLNLRHTDGRRLEFFLR